MRLSPGDTKDTCQNLPVLPLYETDTVHMYETIHDDASHTQQKEVRSLRENGPQVAFLRGQAFDEEQAPSALFVCYPSLPSQLL